VQETRRQNWGEGKALNSAGVISLIDYLER
jgi:hypothetical protein